MPAALRTASVFGRRVAAPDYSKAVSRAATSASIVIVKEGLPPSFKFKAMYVQFSFVAVMTCGFRDRDTSAASGGN